MNNLLPRIIALRDFSLLHFHYSLKSWRITDSNRWPPACKAGALASWANPPEDRKVVPGRLELPTSTLSVWRSNQLSYRTVFKQRGLLAPSFFHSLSIEKQNRMYKKLRRWCRVVLKRSLTYWHKQDCRLDESTAESMSDSAIVVQRAQVRRTK